MRNITAKFGHNLVSSLEKTFASAFVTNQLVIKGVKS